MPLAKFRLRHESDFDGEYRDVQNRQRCWIMQAYWDKKSRVSSLGVGQLTLKSIEIERLVRVFTRN